MAVRQISCHLKCVRFFDGCLFYSSIINERAVSKACFCRRYWLVLCAIKSLQYFLGSILGSLYGLKSRLSFWFFYRLRNRAKPLIRRFLYVNLQNRVGYEVRSPHLPEHTGSPDTT